MHKGLLALWPNSFPATFLAIATGAWLAAACFGGGSVKQWTAPPPMRVDVSKDYTAAIITTLGPVEVGLHVKEAPNTVNNFVFLARASFYDGVPFHRIMKDFMIQTGDPTGSGRGGPGYRIIDEPVSGDYERGVLAMANAGRPNTGGSQFFIVQGEGIYLPKSYTIFGKVTSGMEIVDELAAVPVVASSAGELSVPQVDVRIEKITIMER